MKNLIAVAALMILTSCAVYKAADQPEAKDVSVLKLYNTRVQIIGALGNPTNSNINERGLMVDTFSFVNGYSAASRSARAVGHGVADVATLGLWEVVGTPIEGGFNGSKVSGQVVYNKAEQAIKLEFFEDGKLIINDAAQEYLNPPATVAQAPSASIQAAPQQQPMILNQAPQPQ